MNKQPSFPLSGLDFDHLEQTHDLALITAFQDPSLAYSLILPKGWVMEEEMGEQQAGIGHLVRIGLFSEPFAADATVVQVSFSKIPLEINVMDWVQYQAARSHVDLIYCQHVDFATGPGVDAGGWTGPDDRRHLVRVRGFADNGRIFLVMAMVIAHRYEQKKRDIAIATNSFKLQNPTNSPLLEQWLDITATDPNFHVAYPATWQARSVHENIAGKAGLDFLLAKEDQLLAYLRLKATDQAMHQALPIQQRLQIAKEELAEAGVTMITAWQNDQDPSISMIEAIQGIYIAQGNMADNQIELRCGFVRRGSLEFAATLISVQQEDDPVLWMRSKRAYEIAMATADPTT